MRDDDGEAHEFCRHVRPRLVGALGLMCDNVDTAEELAQEALVRVWLNWGTVRDLGEPSATAWTFRVAINLAHSWWRRKMIERRVLAKIAGQVVEAQTGPDPADSVTVRRAVIGLPRRQRTALVLRYYADLPVAHVAEAMGCAPGTVKALTSQAIASLQSTLGPRLVQEVPHGPQHR